jgi:hypothetical protein
MMRKSVTVLERLMARVGAWTLRVVLSLLLLGTILLAARGNPYHAPSIGLQGGILIVHVLHAYFHPLDTSDRVARATGPSANGGMDSISAQFRNCLVAPSFACWEQAFIGSTGSVPKWFDAFRQAFDTGMREAGKCREVAQAVAQFFRNIGGKPVFIEIRAAQYNYMSLDLPDGTSPGITKNGYHVVVKLGDRIYDAFTGPSGMKAAEYMAHIQARFGFTEKTLTEL